MTDQGQNASTKRRRRRRNPLWSPVLTKELVQLAASRRIFGLRLGFVAMLTLAAVHQLFLSDGTEASAAMGISFTEMVGWLLLSAALLVTPIVTAGLINSEREANTLQLLFLTRLRPLNIANDKGLSRVMLMLLLALLGVPTLFAGLLFGGVDMVTVICVASSWLHAILLAGGLGLLCSAWMRRPAASLVMTYVLLTGWLALLPVGFGALAIRVEVGQMETLHPIAMMLTMSDFLNGEAGVWEPDLNGAGLHAALGLLAYVLCLALATARVGYLARVGATGPARGGLLTQLAQALYRLHPGWLLHRSPLPKGNPYAWRCGDAMTDSLRATVLNVALLADLALLLLAAYALAANHPDIAARTATFFMYCYYLSLLLGTIMLTILGAQIFTRERHAMTLDILLSTRLRARHVVLGAFTGLLRFSLPILAAPIICLVAAQLAHPEGAYLAWPATLALLLYWPPLLLTAIRRSLTATGHGRAIGGAIIVLLAIILGPVLLGLTISLVAPQTDLVGDVLMQSPGYWLLLSAERDHWASLSFNAGTRGSIIMHLALVAGWTYFMVDGLLDLDRLLGRGSGAATTGPVVAAPAATEDDPA